MGLPGQTRQAQAAFRPLVAFDFDGTLTSRDSFLAFLEWRNGTRPYAEGLWDLRAEVLAFLSRRDRGRLKSALVRRFLSPSPAAEIEAEAQRFAVQRARWLLRPDAVSAWRRWQSEGARLVIVTASPEMLVAPFARGLGAEKLIGTRLAVDAQGLITGELDGANCRGPEKVRRLREVFGEDMVLEAAYGDSDGDREMLALAEDPGMKAFSGRVGG